MQGKRSWRRACARVSRPAPATATTWSTAAMPTCSTSRLATASRARRSTIRTMTWWAARSRAPGVTSTRTASRTERPAVSDTPHNAPTHDETRHPMTFMQALRTRWHDADSLVCVGLDPEPSKFPARFAGDPDAVFNFCRAIVDATAPHVCGFKPQIAHFAALGAEDALARLVAHVHAAHPGIPVILDSKRGDIGSTARHYATEAFDRYRADAVTANPYLGRDSLQPFLDRADRGVVILCRTSNPGAGDLQDLRVGSGTGAGRPLYQLVAEKVAREWNGHGNCALVVGATWPEQLREV